MNKIKEHEVPDSELNPYPRSKKKKAQLEFLTFRITDEDGCEGLFETSQEGAKIADKKKEVVEKE